MKDLYVHGIVKDYDESINSINKYLFSENERLNAIIDDLEEKIDKLVEFINSEIEEYNKNIFVTQDMNIYVDGIIQGYQNCLKILGDKENEKD